MSSKISALSTRITPLDTDLLVLANDAEDMNFKITLADLKIELGDLTMATLTTLLDKVGNISYIGKALPGTATSASTWQVFKVVILDGDIDLRYADSGNFSQVWDNRASLTYA